jgi:hypothetical protein
LVVQSSGRVELHGDAPLDQHLTVQGQTAAAFVKIRAIARIELQLRVVAGALGRKVLYPPTLTPFRKTTSAILNLRNR